MVVGVGTALVVGAATFLVTRGPSAPPPLIVAYSEITKVQAYPVPEGSPPPPLVQSAEQSANGRPLSEVRSYIPSPIPASVRCDYSGFGDGLQLSVWLRDGRRLDYFTCAFPGELKPLYDDAWG
jgi:hypothetical protein